MKQISTEFKYKVSMDKFSGVILRSTQSFQIYFVRVTDGESRYECWGYERHDEVIVPGPLTFDYGWVTPGDAVNAAIEDITTPKIVVTV